MSCVLVSFQETPWKENRCLIILFYVLFVLLTNIGAVLRVVCVVSDFFDCSLLWRQTAIYGHHAVFAKVATTRGGSSWQNASPVWGLTVSRCFRPTNLEPHSKRVCKLGCFNMGVTEDFLFFAASRGHSRN